MRQKINQSGQDSWADVVSCLDDFDHIYDDTANDSDKTFTVPDNEIWKINFAHIDFVTDATVGNRIMTFSVRNADGNSICDLVAGVTQAAGSTVHYGYLQGIYRETSVINGEIQVPMASDTYLLPGFSIRVYDSAAISAAGDDMTVSIQYKKWIV